MTKVNKRRMDIISSGPSIFVGRQREIVQIEQALADPAINVVTISGMGGVGKSALARFVAKSQQQSNRFPGGIVWVDCEFDDSLTKILSTIAQAIGLELASLPTTALRDVVVSHMQSNPTLLVLDNYEVVAQNDEVLSFVGRLPKATKTLITSRQAIRIPSREIKLYLDSLTETETAELLKNHLDSDKWAKIDLKTLEAIHNWTGGLPLAITLVAGLFKQGLTLSQIVRSLQESAAVSTPNIPAKIMRQIDINLSAQQRQFLDALSVFAHPVDDKAVAAVSGIENWRLIEKDLTQRSVIEIVNGRYTLHPLVRAFFRTRNSPERLSILQLRMVKYFLKFSIKFQNDFNQIDREWSNIQYSIETADRNKFWPEFAQLILANGQFLGARFGDEYQKWLSRAIEVTAKQNDRQAHAALLHNLGVYYQKRGDFETALKSYEESLQIEEELQDRLGKANTLGQLGTIYYMLRDLDRAKQFYHEALEISKNLDDKRGVSNILGNLGLIARDIRRYEEAEKLFSQSLSISREIGNREDEAKMLTNLGMLARDIRRYEEAEKLFSQSLSISREIGNREVEASLLTDLGMLARDMGRYEEAEKLFSQSLSIIRQIGDRDAEASMLTNLGMLARDMERYEEARKLFSQSLSIIQEIGNRDAMARTLTNLGLVATDMGRYKEAEKLFSQSLSIIRQIGDRSTEANLLANLGTVYMNLSTGDRAYNLQRAIEHYNRALEIYNLQTNQMQWAITQTNLGTIYNQLQLLGVDIKENLNKAITSYESALKVFTRERFPREWLKVITYLTTTYEIAGNWQKAKRLAISVLEAFHGTIANQESLDAIIPWYEKLSGLAIKNQDTEFTTRVYLELAHLFEIQGAEVPINIRDELTKLQELIGDERFVIIWGEVQGALTPILAQELREATQLVEQGLFEQAENKFSRAIEILSEAEDTQERRQQKATILFHRGFCLRKQERWEEALLDLEGAFNLFEKLKDFGGEARVLLEMGHIYGVMNNYEDARLHYMDAYRLYRQANNKSGMALASENLGKLEFGVRMLPQAIQNLEEARQLYIQLGEHRAASAVETYIDEAKVSLANQEAKAENRRKQK